MEETSKLKLRQFLNYFPEAKLPVALSEESIHAFQQENDALPEALINSFIISAAGHAEDDLTEYIPCFRIPDTPDFHAVVFWKASLMVYEYYLVTYDKEGNMLAQAVIAGERYENDRLLKSISTIEEDWIIHIVEGDQKLGEISYDAASSRLFEMELLATGEIIFLLHDNHDSGAP